MRRVKYTEWKGKCIVFFDGKVGGNRSAEGQNKANTLLHTGWRIKRDRKQSNSLACTVLAQLVPRKQARL